MKLSITTHSGEIFQIEVDRTCELQNLKAVIELETQIPAAQQALFFEGRELAGNQTTLQQCNVQEYDVILVRRRAAPAQQAAAPAPFAQPQAGGFPQIDPVLLQQIINNPQMLQQLQTQNPALFQAIVSAFQRSAPQPVEEYDEFDLNTQQRLEEEIRQKNVNQQFEHAVEYAPETFGRVFMLYINCEVNGQKVKAFVDSGAQMTIMSSNFAQKCGLSNFTDTRWTGVAKGVGSAKILGRVHMAQLKIETLFLPVSITILEEQSIDLLLGLDMLKRHQCVLDLKNNVLRIGDVATPFLSESELPASANMENPQGQASNTSASSSSASGSATEHPASAPVSAPVPAVASSSSAAAVTPASNLNVAPNPAGSSQSAPQQYIFPPLNLQMPSIQPQAAQPAPPNDTGFAEPLIRSLMDLGASRAQAIAALQAAGGNADLAASFLFQ